MHKGELLLGQHVYLTNGAKIYTCLSTIGAVTISTSLESHSKIVTISCIKLKLKMEYK